MVEQINFRYRSPTHLPFLKDVAKVYPMVRRVCTHAPADDSAFIRDPLEEREDQVMEPLR